MSQGAWRLGVTRMRTAMGDTEAGSRETPGEAGPVRLSHREGSWEDTGGGEGHSLERVHAKGHVHARAVRQEGSKRRLLEQPEDQDLVPGGTGRAGPGEPGQHPHPERKKHTPRQMERHTWRHTEVKTQRRRQRQIQGDGDTERQRQTVTHTQAGKGRERQSGAGEGPGHHTHARTHTRQTEGRQASADVTA